MQIKASGVLSDYKGRVLLQQTGPKMLVPVSRPLEPGVLPADTLARAFREETALIVMPVRLTGLHYNGRHPGGELTFCYRCTMRGGDLSVPAGYPPAGFFDQLPLPEALAPGFRRQVAQALHHPGGPPVLARDESGPEIRLSRFFGGRAPEPETGGWAVSVRLIVMGENGRVGWVRSGPAELWRLPATAAGPNEAPWETGERLLKSLWPEEDEPPARVAVVEFAADNRALTFVLTAPANTSARPRVPAESLAFAHPEQAAHYSPDDFRLMELADQAGTGPAFSIRSAESQTG